MAPYFSYNDTKRFAALIADYAVKDEWVRVDNLKKELIQKNQMTGHGHSEGFTFKFKLVRRYESEFEPTISTENPLSPLLHGEGDILFDLKEKLNNDRKKLSQGLILFTKKYDTHQQIRDLLPDYMTKNVSTLNVLGRTRPPGLPPGADKILKTQYQKMIDIADYYQANRLIY